MDRRADLTAFIEFPYALHTGEPLWVPPLRSEQRRMLNQRCHPFFDFGAVRLFLARVGRRVVGRVAAVHNPRRAPGSDARQGGFGFFECVDDTAVARALFEAAAAWLRSRQLTSLLGPVNLSTNYECGLLVDGFEHPPAIQMPYNPPYYPGLLAACGFSPTMDLLAWEAPTTVHDNEAVQRLARHAARRRDVRVRPLDMRNFAAETELIRDLYNGAWEANWGFTPMTEREFGEMAGQLRPVVRPELCLIAEVEGEPAGFTLAMPDLAPALAAANGRLHSYGIPVGLCRLLRARRRVDRVRVIAMGMVEAYRNRGVELLLLTELSRAAQRLGYRTAEASWVLADNDRANRRMDLGGARVTKRYRLYQRPL